MQDRPAAILRHDLQCLRYAFFIALHPKVLRGLDGMPHGLLLTLAHGDEEGTSVLRIVIQG